MEHPHTIQQRRRFLLNAGMGLGTAAFSSLIPKLVQAQSSHDSRLHHAKSRIATTKRIIFLFMAGAPSQLDLFDYKPGLKDKFRHELPDSIRGGQRVTAMTRNSAKLIAPSKFNFQRYGDNGIWISELLPHIGSQIEKLCVVKSMHTEAINHDPAKTSFCTGSELPGRPSMGAWLSYGLGSLNNDLPDYIVMPSSFWGGKVNVQGLYSRLWGSGFLPSKHQGTCFQVAGDPVLFLSNPAGVDRKTRRHTLDALEALNQKHHRRIGDPEILTTIAQQEMAFRMQTSVPDLVDLSGETEETLQMYGPDVNRPGSYARNCLLARRMAEKDVRFIQLFHRGWDHHSRLPENIVAQCHDVDQPTAALLQDLDQRGLLKDTLVVFAGEFGRTVYCQGKLTNSVYGRDHHPRCFTALLAGGGIQGGIEFGKTDEYSYNVLEDPVHVRDLHATMLHLLGIDHEKLTFPFQGLDQKLTGVEKANVIEGILA